MHSIENRKKWGLKGAKVRWDREPPFEKRFWSRVNIIGPNECWLWTGAVSKQTGYGKYKLKGKHASSHRIAFILAIGEIPDGLHVCHKCDIRACCNPRHLFLGTNSDNMMDALRKGRLANHFPPVMKGEDHPLSKLTEDYVKSIRIMRIGGSKYKEIAKVFGISTRTAWRVATHKAWSHVH